MHRLTHSQEPEKFIKNMKLLLLKKGKGFTGGWPDKIKGNATLQSVTVYGDKTVALVYYDECGGSCIIWHLLSKADIILVSLIFP